MTGTALEVAEPILSSPFEKPAGHWWIEESGEHRLSFAQLEARSDLGQGIEVPPEDGGDFVRCACKMAAGSGKTMVMGMLAAWSILTRLLTARTR